jgi:hypothetical protein
MDSARASLGSGDGSVDEIRHCSSKALARNATIKLTLL